MSTLTTHQIEDLAKTVAGIEQHIKGFYDNPDNEKAYQDWYAKRYGRIDKENCYEQN